MLGLSLWIGSLVKMVSEKDTKRIKKTTMPTEERKKASKQASKHARKEARKQASKQGSKEARKQGRKEDPIG